ncbi:DUF3515 domain-containing protein [Paenarthrobacter sp. Z7-10]|uniref:DUF3515 domain-containing protein n=1 Tax=Paenarthrobacter sp. Z7-10 TaxID=2787635 RepID=UPI0022A8E18C|nr:DUF3515 domain-containing protein [Paenarthrobacter sp. Z7-10]
MWPKGWSRCTGAALTLAAVSLVATACSAPIDVRPAAEAASPGCAALAAALPSTVAGLQRRETTGQATAAWGSPAGVVLRCGVPAPGPTTEECTTVNGVDWIVHETGDTMTLRTYGRTPATEVVMKVDDSHAGAVPIGLGPAVERIPAVHHCVGPGDVPLSSPG